MLIEMTNNDKSWILKNHSGLTITDKVRPVSIKGTLAFDMFYDKENKQFFLNPKEDYDPPEYRIRDEYQIEIILERGKFSDLPQVEKLVEGSIGSERLKDLRILKTCMLVKMAMFVYAPNRLSSAFCRMVLICRILCVGLSSHSFMGKVFTRETVHGLLENINTARLVY